MFKCCICNKKVDDKGFRVFLKYDTFHLGSPLASNGRYMTGECTTQIRICDKCLKKKGQNLEGVI